MACHGRDGDFGMVCRLATTASSNDRLLGLYREQCVVGDLGASRERLCVDSARVRASGYERQRLQEESQQV